VSDHRDRERTWVYGVVDGGAPEPGDLVGVDGGRVRLVRAGGLAALAGQVPFDRYGADALKSSLEDLERLETLAREHQQVLDGALALGAVIPLRLCTIFDHEDHVRDMLSRERAALEAGLERVRGSAEWGVKAYYLDGQAPEPTTAARAAPSGTEWLERRRAERAAATAEREVAEQRAAAIHARLGEHASAAVLSRPHDRRLSGREGEMVLNAAYLVAAERADAFRGVVDALAREHEAHGLSLELTGPWAPYHFVAELGES
jgi:hypothetical protein